MDETNPHRLSLDQRNHLTVSGVDEVESFDESAIRMTTKGGDLLVRGRGLHIEKLSLDGGDMLVDGTVDALIYQEPEEAASFLSRLFRG